MAMPWDEFLDSIMVKDLLAQPDYEMALDAYKSAMIERTSHAEPPPEVAGRSPESKITSRYLAPSHPPEGAEGSHLEAVCLQPGVQHLEKHFWADQQQVAAQQAMAHQAMAHQAMAQRAMAQQA